MADFWGVPKVVGIDDGWRWALLTSGPHRLVDDGWCRHNLNEQVGHLDPRPGGDGVVVMVLVAAGLRLVARRTAWGGQLVSLLDLVEQVTQQHLVQPTSPWTEQVWSRGWWVAAWWRWAAAMGVWWSSFLHFYVRRTHGGHGWHHTLSGPAYIMSNWWRRVCT